MNEIGTEPQPWRPPDGDKRQQMVNRAANGLIEHFDSVVVICTTRRSDRQTTMTYRCEGNWYACEGSAREWLRVQDERTRQQVRNDDE